MQSVLITGASRGIGAGLSLELSRRGYRVVATARDEQALVPMVSRIRAEGGNVLSRVLDAADTEECVRVIRAIDDELGGLDVIVANAGVGAARDFLPYAWESMREAFHTNFCGAAATLTAVLPRMVERRRGHLVGISSLASLGALPDSSAYCAPKAGLSMLLDCLRLDTEAAGIATTEVKLGFVRTAAVEGATHPLPQLLEVEEVARVLADRLPRREALIVHPKALGAAARVGAQLPRLVRKGLFSLTK